MKTGGRKPGTPNKRTISLQDMADELGIHPIKYLFLLSRGDLRDLGYVFEEGYDPTDPANLVFEKKVGAFRPRHLAPLEMRREAWVELAPYLEAKRKSVEILAEDDSEPPKFIINLAPKKSEEA